MKIKDLLTSENSQQQLQQKYNFRGSGDRVLGRTFTVSLKEGERCSLRVLIHKYTTAKSFKALRTIAEVVYPTHRETYAREKLLSDDDE